MLVIISSRIATAAPNPMPPVPDDDPLAQKPQDEGTNQTTEEDKPVVTPDNVWDYVEDDQQPQPTEFSEEPAPEPAPVETQQPESPDFAQMPDPQKLQWAIANNQAVGFEYTTRKGKYTGWRLVEPYGMFTAKTGNTILVTWDRHRQAIRGFIVNPHSLKDGVGGMHPGTLRVLEGDFYTFAKDKFVFRPI